MRPRAQGWTGYPRLKLPLRALDCKCRDSTHKSLVAVVVGLVGTVNGQAQVVGLLRGQLGQLDGQGVEVRPGDLLVELLGEHVHRHGVLAGVAPQLNLCEHLGGGETWRPPRRASWRACAPPRCTCRGCTTAQLCEHLVGEGGGHDEAGVAHGAAQVDQAALSQQNQVLAVLESVPVHLGLDVGLLLAVLLQPLDLDLAVEVADVADNGVVLHCHEVLASQDVFATSGGDKDVAPLDTILNGGDLITLHGCLQSIDGIDLSDDDPATETPQGLGAAIADISVAGDHGNLASQHHVGGTLDAIDQRLPATVQVVKLGLGDGVVDIDGGNLEGTSLGHLVEVVYTGGGLLRDTLDALQVLWVLLVDQVGQVAAIIEDHVEWLAVGEDNSLLNAPDILFVGLSLPGVDWNTTSCHGSGS